MSTTTPWSPTLISYEADHQEVITFFFNEVWRGSRFPFDPSGAHADVLRIPAEYQSSGGGFWLLLIAGQVVGTVALRRLPDNVAEVKRLNVLTAFREQGLGTRLLRHAIRHARDVGFRTVRLDTVRNSGSAVRLFERHGFTEIPRYNDNPDADLFMQLDLRSNADS
jgi:putative acetyltransferase